jgi:hypothetical protein
MVDRWGPFDRAPSVIGTNAKRREVCIAFAIEGRADLARTSPSFTNLGVSLFPAGRTAISNGDDMLDGV